MHIKKRLEKLEHRHCQQVIGPKWRIHIDWNETEAEAIARFKRENPYFQEGDTAIYCKSVAALDGRPHPDQVYG